MCKSLHDEHERRAKYKYSLQDTVWGERHHKDVLTRHRQQSWYIPKVIVRKIRQDVNAVQVGDTSKSWIKTIHNSDHGRPMPASER